MLKNILCFLLLLVLLFLTHSYLYYKGLVDGEYNYKHSVRIALALESAYQFGRGDCK